MTIIQITPEGYLVLSGDAPKQGRKYALEDVTEGTSRQNRAFHPLVMEFFKSGCHSYNCSSWKELKEYVKRDMGVGYESYEYSDENGIHDAETFADIPPGTLPSHWRGKLKSWGRYTKKERRHTMDLLISTMIQAGVNSKKFEEILEGLNESGRS